MDPSERLKQDQLGSDPLAAYATWVAAARDSGAIDPDAAVLATATLDAMPSARAVLVRVIDSDGVVFFTNTTSRKGREIAANPNVALTSVWTSMHRSVRLEGRAELSSAAESDAYWLTRPRGSQLAALASPQSQPISPDELRSRFDAMSTRHPEGTAVARPVQWGGIRVTPHRIEFWQGQPFRLHDRLVYDRAATGDWTVSRLAP